MHKKASIGNIESIRSLFNLLPDVYYFVKDLRGRFVDVNTSFAGLCGVAKPEEMHGKTDWDFFSADRASLYVQDDRRVISRALPMIHRVEPSPSDLSGRHFVVTSKIPLFGQRTNRVVGIAGLARDLNRSESSLRAFESFAKAVEFIENHYDERITVAQLAGIEKMTVSRFERHFKRTFQSTPIDYVKQIRIRHACRLLVNTSLSILDVALKCGFYDHSHFTHQFKGAMGVSPVGYRKAHQLEDRLHQGFEDQ